MAKYEVEMKVKAADGSYDDIHPVTDASLVIYDNVASGMEAENVQDAFDEINESKISHFIVTYDTFDAAQFVLLKEAIERGDMIAIKASENLGIVESASNVQIVDSTTIKVQTDMPYTDENSTGLFSYTFNSDGTCNQQSFNYINLKPNAVSYQTYAPTEANEDGLKFVVLSEEPTQKYSGYIYFIKG